MVLLNVNRLVVRVRGVMNGVTNSVKPVILVHGGAWKIPDHLVEASRQGAKNAALAGYKVLNESGNATDAVVAAVTELEDDPSFDAGRGSALNQAGEVEMHSMIMRGDTLDMGGVVCIQRVKNPVQAARIVLDESHHCVMNGNAALELARKHGLPEADIDYFVTEYARAEFENYGQYENSVQGLFNVGHDTVGAVALDAHGNLACATSTGGITAQQVGRISDSPLAGSGGYADNDSVAASTTGHGESILKMNLAKEISFCVSKGLSPQEATIKSLNRMRARVGGCGGAVTVDRDGRVGVHHTTPRMTWARIGGKHPGDALTTDDDYVEFGCDLTNVHREKI